MLSYRLVNRCRSVIEEHTLALQIRHSQYLDLPKNEENHAPELYWLCRSKHFGGIRLLVSAVLERESMLGGTRTEEGRKMRIAGVYSSKWTQIIFMYKLTLKYYNLTIYMLRSLRKLLDFSFHSDIFSQMK